MIDENLKMTKNDLATGNDDGNSLIRRPYHTPKLASLGPIHSLVKSGAGGSADGAGKDAGDGTTS